MGESFEDYGRRLKQSARDMIAFREAFPEFDDDRHVITLTYAKCGSEWQLTTVHIQTVESGRLARLFGADPERDAE